MIAKHTHTPTLYQQRGISIIELMIAMTLGIILLTGVIQIFLSSKQAYSTVSGASQTLDSGRLTMHFLSSSISKAGYWGDVNELRVYGPDTSLTLNHSGEFAENAYLYGADNAVSIANVIDGTDQLWLRFSGHDTLPLFNCAGQPVSSTQVAVERYYISEPTGSELVPSLKCETTILVLNKASGNISAPGTPVVSTQTMLTGIDNMQILFGQRSEDANEVQYLKASDVTDWTLIQGVRIAVLASSADEVNSVARASGYTLLDETTATPTDKRARRVFERSIALRNVNY